MTTTSDVYAWPLPEETDTPDGPLQIAALVAAIEATLVDEITPVGTIRPTVRAAADPGWILCKGQLVTKATHPELDTVMSNLSYPWGSTPTAFNVPDLRGRVPVGADDGAGRVTLNNGLGASGGVQEVTLTGPQSGLRTHTHAPGQMRTAMHAHQPGTYVAASHDHGAGTLAAASHTHANGGLQVAAHNHGPGTFAVPAHTHSPGSYGVQSHDHGIYFNTGGPGIITTRQMALSGQPGPNQLATDFSAAAVNHLHLVTGSTDAQTPGITGSSGGVVGTAPGITGVSANTAPLVVGSTAPASPDVVGRAGFASAPVNGVSEQNDAAVVGQSDNQTIVTPAAGNAASTPHTNLQPYTIINFQIKG